MAGIERLDDNGGAVVASATAVAGRALLKQLGPSLRELGVPSTSYIIVNIASGRFVTGKTRQEANQRFAILHAGAKGFMQRVGDVTGDPQAPATNLRSPDDGASRAPHAASPDTGRPRSG
jgi:hypothetical protein